MSILLHLLTHFCVAFHVKTNYLIGTVNHMTDFYRKYNSQLKLVDKDVHIDFFENQNETGFENISLYLFCLPFQLLMIQPDYKHTKGQFIENDKLQKYKIQGHETGKAYLYTSFSGFCDMIHLE